MAVGLSPCSSRREQTTRPSSRGVRVRGGELARRSKRLCSSAPLGRSTTTGMSRRPLCRQASRRLKPSMISKLPSGTGTTRMGSSAMSSAPVETEPGRSEA